MTDMAGARTAAEEVAQSIIGPMRRRKDGRWDWRGQNKRSLEAAAASWVVRSLETDGHRITDLWSPDYDRSRSLEQLTRPELAMILDGKRAALDVTLFTTKDSSTASARGAALRREIETRLTGAADDRSVLGLVVYDRTALLSLTKQQRLDATDAIADAYLKVAGSTTGKVVNLRLDVSFPWLRGASITLTPGRGQRRRVTVNVLAPKGHTAPTVDAFIQERISKKGSQMATWGRAILVIVHGSDATADDVAAGFARLGNCPWWRVYWAGPGPEHVTLVAVGEP
jgi:hypothetical protein